VDYDIGDRNIHVGPRTVPWPHRAGVHPHGGRPSAMPFNVELKLEVWDAELSGDRHRAVRSGLY
jgi:hypothetical protein